MLSQLESQKVRIGLLQNFVLEKNKYQTCSN